ncbi:ABC transporter permease subunit [Bacillus sp. B15-48]|uniref:PhnE/PtxC family ABC transporter permease n=1 Tax=Bacillus sp. B15-48 TaxID=1548601 RepID=UPI001EF2FB9D|nr:ABC transporter permease subunit [Bacillus sp. B15-48]MBM4763421.1 ABC transporter permease subunit [Bacillus sp. B15-48]
MLSFDLHKRKILTLFLLLVFVWSLLGVNWNEGVMHASGISTAVEIFAAMFTPELSMNIILLAIESSWITLVYATTGMSLALILALILGILASGVLATGKRSRSIMKGSFRGILGFMRAIHELVWAWLFVASFGLSPYVAIFALAIPYGGILGRIFADMINDVPDEPIQALRAAGASRLQCLLYGYFPSVKNNILSYTMYRYECAVRSSAIMSFVGLGGLGYQIQLSLNDLRYDEVWTFMYFLIILVVLIDGWSNMLRKRLS